MLKLQRLKNGHAWVKYILPLPPQLNFSKAFLTPPLFIKAPSLILVLKASKGFFPDLLPLSFSPWCIHYEFFEDQSFLAELSAHPLMNSPKKAQLLLKGSAVLLPWYLHFYVLPGPGEQSGGHLGLQGLRPGFMFSFFQWGETSDKQHSHFITLPSRERNEFAQSKVRPFLC